MRAEKVKDLSPEIEAVYEHTRKRQHDWLVTLRMAKHVIDSWILEAEHNGPLPKMYSVTDFVHGISSSYSAAMESAIISQKVSVR